MWSTDTLWFDVAVVMTIFAIGSILFGRFEEHKAVAQPSPLELRITDALVPLTLAPGQRIRVSVGT